MSIFNRDLKREIECCPDCGLPLQFGSGCRFCPGCGYSPCGNLVSTIAGTGVMLSALIVVVFV